MALNHRFLDYRVTRGKKDFVETREEDEGASWCERNKRERQIWG